MKVNLFFNFKKPKNCRTTAKYLFARALFKNVSPNIIFGANFGRKMVKVYMGGQWWNNEPVSTACEIHKKLGLC